MDTVFGGREAQVLSVKRRNANVCYVAHQWSAVARISAKCSVAAPSAPPYRFCMTWGPAESGISCSDVVRFKTGDGGIAARARDFGRVARMMDREAADGPLVDALINATPPCEWPLLATEPLLRTSGALLRLHGIAAEVLRTAPGDALVLARLATVIAETLPLSMYPAVIHAQVRGTAWTQLATISRVMGAFDDAGRALERAGKLIEPFAALSIDMAHVDLERGLLLLQLGDVEGAKLGLSRSRSVFEDHGEEDWAQRCVIPDLAPESAATVVRRARRGGPRARTRMPSTTKRR
jgi:hypothetical protein